MRTETQVSEDSLISRAIEGDRTAFAALYDRNVDAIYRHVYYRVSVQADAEDITQEVFIKAWKSIHRYKKTGAPFVAWLLAIAHNTIIDHYKKVKKAFQTLEEPEAVSPPGTNPESVIEAAFDRASIREAIAKLKEEQQKVVLMRFIDGLSYEEIARALNKTEGAIRVIQYRALKELRRILGSK
ncbi:MAG: sigma-70 family RNA polymerase sigma factor [Chloroflexi bacterium]|nr:sigma-70 family RNA polymerase sigma factor [Chloroflexota bacterium]